ncbi:Hint domain-containing protein [Gluconobacter morbifer]|uniref:Outer membrane protein n=1 Tax=Gluconobacter morbifer G707 TaxID=1088869 RepID=G6XL67_9PROT|nr:Hint domain-containing protein [Gluconobacter morbifer]EHH67495.1 outer membrane protein [Gluconobacter morbifer G707]
MSNQTVSSGILSSGTTVSSGDTLVVANGGTISGTSLEGGTTSDAILSGRTAFQHVLAGGTDSGTTIEAGAKEWLDGTAIGDTLAGVGELHIGSGASATDTSVQTHGHEYVSAGGVSTGSHLAYQGMQFVAGTSNDATLSTNSIQVVSASGMVNDATLDTGATQYDAGITMGTKLNSGGTEIVSSDGVSLNTQIGNGGIERTTQGGVSESAIVSTGGLEDVQSGGRTDNLTVNGGRVDVENGGFGAGTTVKSGSVAISAGGMDINTAVSGGTVTDAGALSDTTITGGTVTIASGGFASATTEYKGYIDVQSGGTTLNTAINGGPAYETIEAGGTEMNASIIRGEDWVSGVALNDSATTLGKIDVMSGGYTSGSTITRHAHETISAGGVASGTILDQQGMDYVMGSSVNATVKGGSEQFISAGGVATDATVGSGSLQYDSGETDGTVLEDHAYETVTSGGVAKGTVVENGAFLTVDAGGEIDGTVLQAGGGIDIDSLQYGDVTKAAIEGDTLVVTENGQSYTLDLAGDYSGYHADLTKAADGSTIVRLGKGEEVCFLPGTMIRTPDGETAIEELRIGDDVLAWVEDAPVTRRITWIGSRRVQAQGGAAAQSGHPVHILKDAIAEGMPYKDLLVTPEHCLFIDGGFVPTRMLVNGRSIFYDRSIAVYDYFHIETENHSVIMADGMLTESYLDTGNRRSFTQHGTVAQLGGRQKSWEQDAAATLTVDRATVEPLFRTLEARAVAAGFDLREAAPTLTDDADLHLVTPQGQVIHPSRTAGDRAVFMIPTDVHEVRLVSRTFRPSETEGPFVDDRRDLGVLVGDVSLYDSGATRHLDEHFNAGTLSGWANPEDGACRWTTGNAVLDLGSREPNSLALLSVQVLAAGPYALDEETQVDSQTA